MPLIHKKTPAAFKKNIEIEMAHGKPQKQAVAIAYSVKDKAGHHKYAEGGECIGPECRGCSSANCYAEGGEISGVNGPAKQMSSRTHDKERRGTGSGAGSNLGGVSEAGEYAREGRNVAAKDEHKRVLGEMQSMKKPNLYAEGGCVGPECSGCSDGNCYAKGGMIKGVHASSDDTDEKDEYGFSPAGSYARAGAKATDPVAKKFWNKSAKQEHTKVLSELHSMPKPHGEFAHGGEIGSLSEPGEIHEDEDQDKELIDDEMKGLLGDELISAFDAKDKKRILEGIEALVLSIMNKG